MSPTFHDGDLVLVDRHAFHQRAPQTGDLVAARPAALKGRAVVKRVAAVAAAGLTLLGDNPSDSLDSRSLGPVLPQELLGRVCRRLWPLK